VIGGGSAVAGRLGAAQDDGDRFRLVYFVVLMVVALERPGLAGGGGIAGT